MGTILPLIPFLTWLRENGFALNLFLSEIAASRISQFAWLDVVVSAAALFSFALHERRKHSLKYAWIPIIATLSVGVSLGLPLLLLMLEIQRNPRPAEQTSA